MEENASYGLFDQIPISFFHPSKYKELLSLKRRYLVGFILIITMMSFFLESLIPFVAWDVSVGGMDHLVTEGIPDFELKDGIFEIESPIDIQMTGLIHLKADSSVENYTQEELDSQYPEVILISKTNMMLKHSGMMYEIKFSDVDSTFNNQNLLEMLPLAKALLVFSLVIAYLVKVGTYLLSGLFFGLICRSIARDKEGKTVPFKTAFIFAIYARAPFIILSGINSCLGNLINAMWVLILGVFLTMHFIFLAERAELGIADKPRE